MKHFIFILLCTFLLAACSKKEGQPGQSNDSILAKPVTTEAIPPMVSKDTASGLIIDQSTFRTPEHQALLDRFSVNDVVRIYHAFKQIRKPGITQDQTDKFLKENKISIDELKAILEEGDIHGWGK